MKKLIFWVLALFMLTLTAYFAAAGMGDYPFGECNFGEDCITTSSEFSSSTSGIISSSDDEIDFNATEEPKPKISFNRLTKSKLGWIAGFIIIISISTFIMVKIWKKKNNPSVQTYE